MTSVSGSGERILAILDLFSEERPEWRTDDMMEALGYSRPTLYRYVKTLKDAGYLTASSQASYALGPKVTELDFLMRRADPLIALSNPYLARLAERCSGSAFVLRWYGNRLLCIASVSVTDKPRSSYPRGRPMPLGRGAGSRAIAAFLPAAERRALVDRHFTEFTTIGIGDTKDAVTAELRRVRRAGVAIAYGEVTQGLVGIAAPILAGDAVPQGALCLSAEAAMIDESTNEDLAADIKQSAEEITRCLDDLLAERARPSGGEAIAEKGSARLRIAEEPVGDSK